MTPTEETYLFVPGNRPDRILKAIDAGADAVIVDLEDAVAPADKEAALAALETGWGEYVRRAEAGGTTLLVRVNAVDTPWHLAELAACQHAGVLHVLVPKAADAAVLARVTATVPGVSVYPLIESAEGFERLREIARAPGVVRLLFGSVDLMLDLGIRDEGFPLHYFRTSIVLESRLAGLAAPVDGVCVDLQSEETLRNEVMRARSFGFGAKLLIHPRQVGPTRQGFASTAAEVEWATRVLDAAASAGGAAIAVDGKMVDRPVLLQAQRILDRSERSYG